MTDRPKATTHADNCWSWGAKHYKCAVREIRAKRAEVAAWRELSDRMEAVLDQLQAEIKALRAEVEGWKGQHMRDSAELRRLCQHRDEYKARAEQLAEALRGWWKAHRPVGWTEDQHRSCPHVNLVTEEEIALATALLRDHEGGLSDD